MIMNRQGNCIDPFAVPENQQEYQYWYFRTRS